MLHGSGSRQQLCLPGRLLVLHRALRVAQHRSQRSRSQRAVLPNSVAPRGTRGFTWSIFLGTTFPHETEAEICRECLGRRPINAPARAIFCLIVVRSIRKTCQQALCRSLGDRRLWAAGGKHAAKNAARGRRLRGQSAGGRLVVRREDVNAVTAR